ncbi:MULTISPECIES: azurin [Myroides]|uniref:Azurin n=1 Tax=Myroides albus TaxID=2562892 RepID=A0A6I3LKB0_9FLAO|nr:MULTISPECIES: azurin [Myroides]MTG99048.1 azurin [Myroides albus]MVX36646.1 azurin [Myroides sp. LoEW2-1]UVD80405.1 azurin [Myroides albus]
MKGLNTVFALAITAVMFVSCGDKKQDAKVTPEGAQTEATTDKKETVRVLITGDDQMKFNKTEIKVPVGKTIKLTLKHVGKMDKAVMGHNWVLLKPGTDLTAFATEGAQSPDTDYIPASGKDNVVAHTKTLGGGESDTIEFTITEAGTYDFLCSFPAHFAMMQGKLIAE